MTALILDLMGAPAEVIAQEYALTRIGTEPLRGTLLPAIVTQMAGLDATEGSVEQGMKVPGLREFLSSSADVMLDFVSRLKDNYSGAEGYCRTHLGLTDADVDEIKGNLRPAINSIA